MTTSRPRWLVSPWTWYVLVWVLDAAVYGTLIQEFKGDLGWTRSFISGLQYVVPSAILGVFIWQLTERLRWPPRSVPAFLALHVLLACVFSALCSGAEVGFLTLWAGWRAARALAPTFIGFQFLDGLWVYGLIASGSYMIRMVGRLRQQEALAARAESLRVSAELAALRGQLNPHFLFNTLHTVTALVTRDPANAERALLRLGDLLRYVLDVKRAAREDVTLAEELQFARDYLALEQLRLGDRLKVVVEVEEDALECVLPSLTLQPLIENAIKHGIAPRAAGGTVRIAAELRDDDLHVVVADDGGGAAAGSTPGAGLGLRAVRQRLEIRYASRARLETRSGPGEGFVVSIVTPAHVGAMAGAAAAGAT